MNLFENEKINISEIVLIDRFKTEAFKKTSRFSTPLSTYELIFFLTGDAICYFGDVKTADVENSVRYLPKGVEVKEYRVERTKNGDCIDIYFNTSSPMPKTALGYQNLGFLKDRFLKIYNIWSKKAPGYYVKCMNILYDIIDGIKKAESLYVAANQNSAAEKALGYISENFRNPDFSYDELCAVSGFSSYSYFKKIFISKYKIPPVKMVTKFRIDYAKELLVTRRYSVTEIAEKCGFENVYYFSTVFKKLVGVSPKNYIAKKQNFI